MYNNSNEMVRGYFMRQSEGGYAPKNFKYNQKNNNNLLKNFNGPVTIPKTKSPSKRVPLRKSECTDATTENIYKILTSKNVYFRVHTLTCI